MNKSTRTYKLDDGTITTVDEMVAETGYPRSTCYSRLIKFTDPSKVYKSISPTRCTHGLKDSDGRYTYTLDDGSEWTSATLAEHLGCKVSTAGTRLSCMDGISERVLKPISDKVKVSKEVSTRHTDRMYYDIHGHWALINRCI